MILPKPLIPIPVLDKPIIEVIVRQLVRFGVDEIIVSTGHLKRLIQAYLDDGSEFDVRIRYVEEDHPLGTAGPIGIVDGLKDDFFVINGDTLCDVDFGAMLAHHREHRNGVTIGTFKESVKIDLGVVKVGADKTLVKYLEKPKINFRVSMGVYLFNSGTLPHIVSGETIDLPTFVLRLRDRGFRVGCFEHKGIWLDLGRPSDYERVQAREAFIKRKFKHLFEA